MKYIIVSDIHGSISALDKVLAFFEKEKGDMLLILGDILNYGPRNRIPGDINPAAIVERLNAMADRIVAVRGNCDSEVDQMLLSFPMMADYTIVVDNGKKLFLTHGHKYGETSLPLGADALFCGHTHLWKLERNADGLLVCNTGSVTFPKGGNVPTFAMLSDGEVSIRQLDGSVLKSLKLKVEN